jgi:hypothetical protein
MKPILLSLLLLLFSSIIAIDSDELMSERDLRGLLDMMTITQLKAISFEIDIYGALHYNLVLIPSEGFDCKLEYIDSIVAKVSRHLELLKIDLFGEIILKVSKVVEMEKVDKNQHHLR